MIASAPRVARYQTEGLAGLLVRKGRDSWARLLSPFPLSRLEPRSKPTWQSCRLCAACSVRAGGSLGFAKPSAFLREHCLTTVWRTLHRWKLAYKRGRRHVHSPDWEYEAKVQRIETITWYSRLAPGRIVRLYEDELTYYRHPTLAQGYALCGSKTPHAEQGTGYNSTRREARVLGCRNGAASGLAALAL